MRTWGCAVRRLRSARSALPLVLLVAALTALMHASPAHACESATAAHVTTAHAAAEHAAAGHATAPAQPAGDAQASAAPAPGSPVDDDGAAQHCTSAAPPQAPVLGAGALVSTVAVAAPDATRSVVPAPSSGDRGPPAAPRPLLCVWRV